MAEILLIRHALTDAADRWFAGRMRGVDLNERGVADAAALARRLEDVVIDAIYSSPMDRCLQTAEPIAHSQDLEVKVDEAFTELDCGSWTGKPFEELRQDSTFGSFNSFRCGTRPPDGELAAEVQARMVGGVLNLIPKHARQTVAVVSHSDPIKTVLAYFMGFPLDLAHRLAIDTASVSVLELSDNNARVKLVNHRGPLGMLEI